MRERMSCVKRKHLVFSGSIFCLSLLVAFLLYTDQSVPEGYELLWILPFSYGIFNLLFTGVYKYIANLAVIAILSFSAFRMVVTPFVMFLGKYDSAFYHSIDGHITQAVCLMVYEMVAVFVVMIFACSKNELYLSRKRRKKHTIDSLSWILFLMILFLVVSAFLFPNSITSFKSIFDIRNDDFTTWTGLTANKFQAGTIDRIVTTLFTMVFSWIRYLLPIAIMLWCRENISQKFIALVISSTTILGQMLFITATIMDSILCAFVLFIALSKIYQRYKKQLLCVAVVGFFAIISVYFFSRFVIRMGTGGNIWAFVSENANAYVGGVVNVAAMFNVPTDKKWSTLFYNMYGAIPFNSTLFGLSGEKLAAVFNVANGSRDGHIPPTIGASYYYFSAVFAPIESIIYTKFAILYGEKCKNEKNIWRYVIYALVTIMMVMGFTAYNSAIVLNYVTTLLIPLLVLASFTNDDKFEIDYYCLEKEE